MGLLVLAASGAAVWQTSDISNLYPCHHGQSLFKSLQVALLSFVVMIGYSSLGPIYKDQWPMDWQQDIAGLLWSTHRIVV